MRRNVSTSRYVVCLLAAVLIPTAAHAELVGWWTFDGHLDDASDFENHATAPAPVFEDDVPEVQAGGQSLRFNGSSGVEIAASESLDSIAFTYSFWVLDRGQRLPFSRITSRGSDSFEISVGTGAAGDELKYFSHAVGWTSTFHPVPKSTWQHIAVVSTGSEILAYADGELVYGPQPFTSRPTGVLHLGYRHNRVEGFVGSLDDVALFSEALSAGQILEIADAGTDEFLDSYVPGRTAPVPPQNLRATPGDGNVSLEWDAIENADGFDVYRSDLAGGERVKLNGDPIEASSYEDRDVENGDTYFYVVTAFNEFGESSPSREVSATPLGRIEDPEEKLVGWWPLDGDFLDASINDNDAQSLNVETLFTEEVPEATRGGEALTFSGTDGFEVSTGDPRLSSSIFSLTMFVRNDDQVAGYSRLTSRSSDSFETAIGNGVDGEDKLKFYSPSGGWRETRYTPPFGQWMHVAFVADGTQMTVYADGEVVHGPVPFESAPTGVFRVGIRANSVEGFIGEIDDLALFDVPLAAVDVQAIAESGIAGLIDGDFDSPDVFVRGDVDSSGAINLSDGVNLLLFLFQQGTPPACADAADVDDSGTPTLTDAVVIFQWLFQQGAPPPEPSPSDGNYPASDCGADPPDLDALDCSVLSPQCAG